MGRGSVPDDEPRSRAAVVVGVVGLAWLVLHALHLLGPFTDATFLLLAVTTVIAVVVGVRRWKPVPTRPWWLLIGALVLFLLSGWLRTSTQSLGDLSEHRSLAPDLVALPGYLVLGAGLVGMIAARSRRRQHDLDAVLDAVLAGLAALALAWVYLVTPALSALDVPVPVRVLLACYPPLSVFLVAIGARLAFSPGIREAPAFRLMLAALLCMLVGDVVYMLVDLQLVSVPAELVDLPYALAYLGFTTAVLHRSMTRITEPLPVSTRGPRQGRLVVVALALCIPAAVILFRTTTGMADRVVLASIVVLLTATAVLRMYRALREHAQAVERLAHQASHDALTGLPNRLFVEDQLSRLLGVADHSRRPAGGVALLLLDIDRFKLVNESLGHGVGDELLVAVAARMQETAEPHSVVARVGGDEFTVVLEDTPDAAAAVEAAERVRLALASPFGLSDAEIPVSASVGVAWHRPGDDATAESMFREADTAMYRAKDRGGNAAALFDDSMRVGVGERLTMERELRRALERGELDVHYQPIVATHDGRVGGFEALLRWTHPTLGSVPPDEFVPIAEDTGLIVEIGEWVLGRACAQLRELRESMDGANELWMAVNLSARQLRDDALLDHVARALVSNRLPASSLCLELTESELMENVRSSANLLSTLREYGVRVAVDDFGTGYSSFAYLKELPVDEVKIDRSFIVDLPSGGVDRSMVEAILALARSLRLSVVAEGVEADDQAAALRDLGCPHAQGFLYSSPIASDELAGVIRRLGVTGQRQMRVISGTA